MVAVMPSSSGSRRHSISLTILISFEPKPVIACLSILPTPVSFYNTVKLSPLSEDVTDKCPSGFEKHPCLAALVASS